VTTHVGAGIAFLAGLVSFVSPCVLPLVPAYLSFLTGSTLEELQSSMAAPARARVIAHAVAFIIGFTIVFVALGASASAIGGVLKTNRHVIAQVGGVIIIILGLQMIGVFRLKFLAMDKRLHLQPGNRSFFMSGIVGIAFAAGWSPCIGPILAAILAIASQSGGAAQGAWLLFIYSMGLAVPFIALALAFGAVLPALNRMKRFLPAIEVAAGVFMILVGIVLVNDWFLPLSGKLYQYVPTPKI
jgi:cytochrome c-type biogenesis protein